jgi:hypothetical protein
MVEIEAWFSSSDTIRTPGAPSVANSPRLAANPVGKMTAAPVPRHAAMASSRSWWTGRDPTMSRDAPDPVPQRSMASIAAAWTAG